MKFTSLLFGDLADLFQDGRIDDAATTADRASIATTVNRSQITQVAWSLEQKILQLQRDNAVLGMLVEQLFGVLAEQQPERAAQILESVKEALSGPQEPDNIEPLKKALDLPKSTTPKAGSRPKPVIKRPARPALRPGETLPPKPLGQVRTE